MRFFNWLFERNLTYDEALEIFGINREQAQDKEFLNKHWKKLALKHHPDRGGSAEKMQNINAAYDILKRGSSSTGSSKSSGQQKQDFEQRQKEREQKGERAYQNRKQVRDVLKNKFKVDKFVQHFEKISGKDFETDVIWRDIERASYVSCKARFESADLETVITLDFTVHDMDDVDNPTIYVSREVFHKNKSHRIGKQKTQMFPVRCSRR